MKQNQGAVPRTDERKKSNASNDRQPSQAPNNLHITRPVQKEHLKPNTRQAARKTEHKPFNGNDYSQLKGHSTHSNYTTKDLPEDYVLIADDDTDDLALISQALRESGCELPIYTCPDGVSVINHLSQCGHCLPKAVIMDFNMPKITGYEVLKHIKAAHNTKRIPVFIISTSSSRNDRTQCITAGADGFYVKPDNFHDLLMLTQTLTELIIVHEGK